MDNSRSTLCTTCAIMYTTLLKCYKIVREWVGDYCVVLVLKYQTQTPCLQPYKICYRSMGRCINAWRHPPPKQKQIVTGKDKQHTALYFVIGTLKTSENTLGNSVTLTTHFELLQKKLRCPFRFVPAHGFLRRNDKKKRASTFRSIGLGLEDTGSHACFPNMSRLAGCLLRRQSWRLRCCSALCLLSGGLDMSCLLMLTLFGQVSCCSTPSCRVAEARSAVEGRGCGPPLAPVLALPDSV